MTFSPDSKYIATGSHTGKVNLIGVESGIKEETLDTRSKFTMSIAYVRKTFIIVFFLHFTLSLNSVTLVYHLEFIGVTLFAS